MGDGLDQMDDMGEICEMMKSLQIPTKGLKNCEEMKAKLRDFLNESATKRVSEVSILFFSIAIAWLYGKQIPWFSANGDGNFVPLKLLLTELENWFFLVEAVSQAQSSSRPRSFVFPAKRFITCQKITFSDTKIV